MSLPRAAGYISVSTSRCQAEENESLWQSRAVYKGLAIIAGTVQEQNEKSQVRESSCARS